MVSELFPVRSAEALPGFQATLESLMRQVAEGGDAKVGGIHPTMARERYKKACYDTPNTPSVSEASVQISLFKWLILDNLLGNNSQAAETTLDGSDTEADVLLYPRAVVVAKETVGSLGGMIISTLLRPRNWKPPVNRRFFLDSYEVGELCYAAEQIFMHEPTVLQLKAPTKLFGDLHGQFRDLMRLFDEYGYSSTAGDITVYRSMMLGTENVNTIIFIIEYPRNVHLIRGNHEAADINALFGFRLECIERMGENDGIWAWIRFNQLFNYLPLAALIEKKIICMHGGIGRPIHTVEQIEKLKRPITMNVGSLVLMDLLWSDPTENDSVEGLRPNARGPGLVTFGAAMDTKLGTIAICDYFYDMLYFVPFSTFLKPP
ncbi:hypothetical protein AgCh_020388 [Apium graveolens]